MFDRNSLKSASPYLLLCAVALMTLFFRLGALPFIGSDECRYARIAQEMSDSRQWVTPILQGLPWLEKPPLYYWATIPMIRVFGMSEAAARVAPALFALLSSTAVCWLGTRLWSRRAGLWSGLILLTAIGFVAFGRSASMDMPFTACLTIAFVLLGAAILDEKIGWRQTVCGYVLIGGAVLAKGPIALVLAAGVLVLFWALDEQGGALRRIRVIPGTLVALAVSAPWFYLAFRENGFSFISVFFINHNLARYVTDIHHHDQPVYYFLMVLPALLFPWSGWLPALLPSPLTRRRLLDWRTWDRSTLFLICWIVFPLAFFSLSGSKLPGYVLPCIPAVALLLGRGFGSFAPQPAGGLFAVSGWISFALSVLLAVAFPVVFEIDYGGAWKSGLLLGIAVLAPAVAAFWFVQRRRFGRAIQATAAQAVVFLVAATVIGIAPLSRYHSAREIAAMALAADTANEPIVTFYYFHHTLHYYTGYRVGSNITDPGVLVEFARQHATVLVVTEIPGVDRLREIPQIHADVLGQQGNLRLVRVHAGK